MCELIPEPMDPADIIDILPETATPGLRVIYDREPLPELPGLFTPGAAWLALSLDPRHHFGGDDNFRRLRYSHSSSARTPAAMANVK